MPDSESRRSTAPPSTSGEGRSPTPSETGAGRASDGSPPAAGPATVRDPQGYWRANRNLIAALLLVWGTVSFGCGILFVEQLNEFSLGTVPLGFWFAQQGSIFVFVILIFVYALAMDRLDCKYGVKE